MKIRRKTILFFLLSFQIFSQSQEEILRDLRDENVSHTESKISYLEKLKAIYLSVLSAVEGKDDKLAIKEASQLEINGIRPEEMKIKGSAELSEDQIYYLKIRRLRAEAYYNLREFKKALPDSKFIVENHPRLVVFDYTRYAASLYYSGDRQGAKKILADARAKLKNENDLTILRKTNDLLFGEY